MSKRNLKKDEACGGIKCPHCGNEKVHCIQDNRKLGVEEYRVRCRECEWLGPPSLTREGAWRWARTRCEQ